MEKGMISKEVIEEAKKRADEYLDSHMIASFALTNITHTRIGGFNARSRSGSYFEYPREQSLKGVWRWWLRALLSGTALSDIEQKVNELLGSSDTPAAFRITLTTNRINQPVYEESLENIPRLKLLSMGLQHGQQSEKEGSLSLYKPSTLELIVNIFSDKQRPESMIIIYALILAITFSGVGSITRRGFGKFAFKIRKCPDNVISVIKSIQSAKKQDELEAALKELIKSAAIATERIYGERKGTVARLLQPALDKDGNYFKLKVISMGNICDAAGVLQRIGNATLKSEWKYLKCGRNRSSLFKPGGEFHTWVLGLPRYQQNSGYEIPSKGNEARRSSAILITPHRLNDEQWCAVVLGFKSLDWPSKIIHKPRLGSRVGCKEINPQGNFDQYFEYAFEMVEKCLKDNRGGRQRW